MELLIGGAIAALFLVPALWYPRLGRALLGLMFIGHISGRRPSGPDRINAR